MCDDYNGGSDIGGDITDVSDIGSVSDDSSVLDGLDDMSVPEDVAISDVEDVPIITGVEDEEISTLTKVYDEEIPIVTEEENEEVPVIAENEDEITSTVTETEKTPMEEMTEYMIANNYGQGDYTEYSQDPEYQAINDRLLEQEGRPPADYSAVNPPSDPMADMTEYMIANNYGQGDYTEYSQDPEYQAINDRLLEQEGRPPADYSAVSASVEEISETEDIGGEVTDTETEDVLFGLDALEETNQEEVEDTEEVNDPILDHLDGTAEVDPDEISDFVQNEFEEQPVTEEISTETEETTDSVHDESDVPNVTEEITEETDDEFEEQPVTEEISTETEETTDSIHDETDVPNVTEEITAETDDEFEVQSVTEEISTETEETTDSIHDETDVPSVTEEITEETDDEFEEQPVTEEISTETEETTDSIHDETDVPSVTEEMTDETDDDFEFEEETYETSEGTEDYLESEFLEPENVELEDDLPENSDALPETDGEFESNAETIEPEISEVSTDLPQDIVEEMTEKEDIPGLLENFPYDDTDYEEEMKIIDPDYAEFRENGQYFTQGINEYGYMGTCGPTSQANAVNYLLETNALSENKVLTLAVENDLCETDDINPSVLGGTTTDQFMELYDKLNESIGDKLEVERFDYENALSAEEMAERIEEGSVLNIAVDADTLFDENTHIPGQLAKDEYTDHWITVTGVDRNPDGSIAGFKIVDSGGGESYADLDKYERMCFGEEGREMLDPTCIVVSKKQG